MNHRRTELLLPSFLFSPPLPTSFSQHKSHPAALRRKLTITRDDPERDGVAGLLDQVDDVRVGLVGDGAAVDGQYPVPDLQLPTAVCRAALDDTPYFVGHGHTRISSFVCLFYVLLFIKKVGFGGKWEVLLIDGCSDCVDWFVARKEKRRKKKRGQKEAKG